MKQNLTILLTGAFFFITMLCINAQSMKTDKILIDTTLLTAVEVTLEPGQKTNQHTHPAHFFYALTDGKLHVTYSDGKSEDWDLKAGDSGYGDPERPHVTQNSGTKTLKFIIVELKEHPYMAEKKKK